MARLVFMLLLLAMAGHTSATWCHCNPSAGDTALQNALDYACGKGADCSPIGQQGSCYNPNGLLDHCNYAVNSYFQNHNQQQTACNFNGAAYTVSTDPSTNDCKYPATGSSTTPMTSPTMGTGMGTPSTMGMGMGMPSTTGSPFAITPPTGYGIGGTNTGLGPAMMDPDTSDGRVRLRTSILLCSSTILTFSALVFW